MRQELGKNTSHNDVPPNCDGCLQLLLATHVLNRAGAPVKATCASHEESGPILASFQTVFAGCSDASLLFEAGLQFETCLLFG